MSALSISTPTPDDWAVVRGVRLAALADSPDAFESSLAGEQELTEEDWRARLQAGGQRLGRLDDVPVGAAGGVVHRGEHHLVGMWVSPTARGHGVAGALVAAVVDWAREQQATRLHLWVVGDNEPAHRLYRRHGFRPTGRVQPLPTRPWQPEQQYALELG